MSPKKETGRRADKINEKKILKSLILKEGIGLRMRMQRKIEEVKEGLEGKEEEDII